MLQTIEVEEHRTRLVSSDLLSEEEGTALFRAFGDRIDVQFPSPRTGGLWALTSRGYVGALAVAADTTLVLRPKLPVANIARMLQCAYDLPVYTFSHLARCRTVPDLYEQLVGALLVRVRALLRQGIHQRYRAARRSLTAVRGRIRVEEQVRQPIRLALPCAFEERTPDVLENRVLLWTLDRVLRAGLVGEDLQREARLAHRELLSSVALHPTQPEEIDAIAYDRLTQRYQGAHRICRLLLEAAGPVPEQGAARSVPFLLNMPALFERFVARWLATRLPPDLAVQAQERSVVGEGSPVEFYIDMVVYRSGGQPLCVLDTKYKVDGAPSANDVAQVGFYALLKGCPFAGLIYPRPVPGEWCGASGQVETFRATFDVGADMDVAGGQFLADLLQRIREPTRGEPAQSAVD